MYGILAVALVPLGAGRCGAQVASDQAAALIVYPYVATDTSIGLDTVVRLANASDSPVDVLCFLEDSNAHCGGAAGAVCTTADDCASGVPCVPGWQFIDFTFQLTGGRSVEWPLSVGTDVLGGMGTIPGAPEHPLLGSLRCLALGAPMGAENALEGTASVTRVQNTSPEFVDVAKYDAAGFPLLGSDNGDNVLDLGAEYAGCPNVNTVDHFFSGAVEPAARNDVIDTTLVLLPCSADYATGVPATTVVHLNVLNEFGQRLGTAERITAQQVASLRQIHPFLFDVGVQGTLTGQTRILSLDTGLLVLPIESQESG